MNKSEIINIISRCQNYKSTCYNITKDKYIADDLYQEMMVVLLEYNEAKLIQIYERGHIKWFITGLLVKMFHSKTSPFYFKFKQFSNISEEISGNEFTENQEPLTEIPNEIDTIYHTDNDDLLKQNNGYAKVLLKMVAELGSVQKVSEMTGIPYLSVWLPVNKLKQELKKQHGKV